MPNRNDTQESTPSRQLVLTPANEIQMLPTNWLWDQRIPAGELTLLAGKEGIGKSTAAIALAAAITTGHLEGDFYGSPRSIVVAASEDDWARTIVPRLTGAGADLAKVRQVKVVTRQGFDGSLTLPLDVIALEAAVNELGDVGLLLFDPLMSRLAGGLDSHKDHDVRKALEPLTQLGQRTGVSVLALMHVSKAASDDPLAVIMASKAFVAVARSVLFTIRNPEVEGEVLLGLVKSNLGPLDVPTRRYTIEEQEVGRADCGKVITTGVLRWLGDSNMSVCDAQASGSVSGGGTAVIEAAEWLNDWLSTQGRRAESKEAKQAARAAGHSDSAIWRATKRIGIIISSEGFPRRTFWELPWGSGDQVTPPTTGDATDLVA